LKPIYGQLKKYFGFRKMLNQPQLYIIYITTYSMGMEVLIWGAELYKFVLENGALEI
jgi:hypothetical protein